MAHRASDEEILQGSHCGDVGAGRAPRDGAAGGDSAGIQMLTLGGFLIGLVESFLYGAYAGLAFGLIHNALAKRSAFG